MIRQLRLDVKKIKDYDRNEKIKIKNGKRKRLCLLPSHYWLDDFYDVLHLQ